MKFEEGSAREKKAESILVDGLNTAIRTLKYTSKILVFDTRLNFFEKSGDDTWTVAVNYFVLATPGTIADLQEQTPSKNFSGTVVDSIVEVNDSYEKTYGSESPLSGVEVLGVMNVVEKQ